MDNSGSVNVLWVTDGGAWQNGPVRLTGPGFARPGASVALGHQTSMQQLDAFVARRERYRSRGSEAKGLGMGLQN